MPTLFLVPIDKSSRTPRVQSFSSSSSRRTYQRNLLHQINLFAGTAVSNAHAMPKRPRRGQFLASIPFCVGQNFGPPAHYICFNMFRCLPPPWRRISMLVVPETLGASCFQHASFCQRQKSHHESHILDNTEIGGNGGGGSKNLSCFCEVGNICSDHVIVFSGGAKKHPHVGWLVGWLAGWLLDGWLVGWLPGWLGAGWLIGM